MGSSAASLSTCWTGAHWSGITARPLPTLLPSQQVGHQPKHHQPLGTGTEGQASRGTGPDLSNIACVPGTLPGLSHLTLYSQFTISILYMRKPRLREINDLRKTEAGLQKPGLCHRDTIPWQVLKSDRSKLLFFSASRLTRKPRGSWGAGKTMSPQWLGPDKALQLSTPLLVTSLLWASASIPAKWDENSSLKVVVWIDTMLWKPWSTTLNEKHRLWLFPVETPEFKSQVHFTFISKALLSRKLKMPND